MLQESGFQVDAVDIPQEIYDAKGIFNVVEYDGLHLPFANASFDVVFSSNCLEARYMA